MAANQARVAAEICLSGFIRVVVVGGGHCTCGRAVGKGDVMGFSVTATEDRKGRNSGAGGKKKKGRRYCGNFWFRLHLESIVGKTM